jgi:hypothetical protein
VYAGLFEDIPDVHRSLLFVFGIVGAVGRLIGERFRPRDWTNLEIPVSNAGRT